MYSLKSAKAEIGLLQCNLLYTAYLLFSMYLNNFAGSKPL